MMFLNLTQLGKRKNWVTLGRGNVVFAMGAHRSVLRHPLYQYILTPSGSLPVFYTCCALSEISLAHTREKTTRVQTLARYCQVLFQVHVVISHGLSTKRLPSFAKRKNTGEGFREKGKRRKFFVLLRLHLMCTLFSFCCSVRWFRDL